MFFNEWLIPLLIILAIALLLFYVVVSRTGGSGERTDGRTMVDKPCEDEEPPEG